MSTKSVMMCKNSLQVQIMSDNGHWSNLAYIYPTPLLTGSAPGNAKKFHVLVNKQILETSVLGFTDTCLWCGKEPWFWFQLVRTGSKNKIRTGTGTGTRTRIRYVIYVVYKRD